MNCIVLVMTLSFVQCAVAEQWTWLYVKHFSSGVQHQQHMEEKKEICFSKHDTPLFNQAICSFNAHKPSRGFFRFNIQVRDAHTKKWYKKHIMYDWGACVQRSYTSEKNDASDNTSFHHVRLELPHGAYGDGMRLCVEAYNGASMCKLASLYVNIVNLHNFEHASKEQYLNIPSIVIERITPISQMRLAHAKREVLCSPTSASMVIQYVNRLFNSTDLLSQYYSRPESIADTVYDNALDTYGNWIFNIAEIFIRTEGMVYAYVRRLSSFTALCTQLRKGFPVVVSVRGPLYGAPREYANGHLLVVAGWDQSAQEVLCYDPAFEETNAVFVRYPIKHFMQAWDKSRRLAYCIQRATH